MVGILGIIVDSGYNFRSMLVGVLFLIILICLFVDKAAGDLDSVASIGISDLGTLSTGSNATGR
jgi:hypothetical protein